jgi:hypothetical protein
MKMKIALKKVETSKEDKLRDKKMGYKEGSKNDMKADKAQAKKIIKKSK